MPVIRKIKETCLYVSDLQQTRDFYHGILGLPVMSMKHDTFIFFRAGEDVLLCFNPEATQTQTSLPPHFAYGKQHFAFECPAEDYQAWIRKLEVAGITIEHRQDWGNDIHSFYFRDPDGHSVEIAMPGLWDHD